MEQFIILRGVMYNLKYITEVKVLRSSIIFSRKDLPEITIEYDQVIKCEADIRALRNSITNGATLIELAYGSRP